MRVSSKKSPDITDDLPPAILFKYQSFDRQRLASILTDSRIWFGSPLAFNDPFDCFPIIDLTGTEEEFRKLAQSVLERERSDLPLADRRRMVDEIVERGGHRVAPEAGNHAWRRSAERLGMLCLTERADNQLMWGHYASSHSGICLGFDTTTHPFNLALKVGYSDERPTFRVMERGEEKKVGMIFSALRAKASHWDYEREWRVFMPDHIGLTQFDPKALKVVISGALTKREDEDWLLKVLRQRKEPVTLLKCRLNPTMYQLEADPIDFMR